MLINLSNHPFRQWSKSQIEEAAKSFGSVYDLLFPAVPPEAETKEIAELAKEVVADCLSLLKQAKDPDNAVHIMGELTLCFTVVAMLQKAGITCVASTSVRNAEIENGIKSSVFSFCRFREYSNLSHRNQSEF